MNDKVCHDAVFNLGFGILGILVLMHQLSWQMTKAIHGVLSF